MNAGVTEDYLGLCFLQEIIPYLNQLKCCVLNLRIWILKVDVQNVKYVRLVDFTTTDLVVF